MPTVIAEELFDNAGGKYPRLAWGTNGWTGERHFRVNTGDTIGAITATGVPARGAPWSSEMPQLVAVSADLEFITGRDTAASNGWHDIRVQYAETAMSADFTAQPGQAFSTFRDSATQVQVNADVSGNPLPPGFSKEKNLVEVVIEAYRGDINALQAWLGIQNRINANAVTLPAVRGFQTSGGGGVSLTVSPGQLLARGFAMEPVREDLVKFTYTFGLGPVGAFKVGYRDLNSDGEPTGAEKFADIQGTASFPGAGVLW